MRICLASIHPRMLSGQIDSLVGLAKGLEGRGHRVTVVSAFDQRDLLGPDRLASADGDNGLLLGKLFRIGRILSTLKRAAKDADIVQLNLPTPAFSFLGDLLQARVRVPVVVGYEAHLADGMDLLRRGRLFRSVGFYLPRLLINNGLVARLALYNCAKYLVGSHFQKEELLALGMDSEKIRVIPNLVDWEKLTRQSKVEARGALGLPEGPIVSYAGHFNHIKGLDVLLRAFPRVLEQFTDAHLVLAWSGLGPRQPVDRLARELGISSRLIWMGRISVAQLISASDVFVLPYRLTIGQSAYPGLLLEAMSIGVPLVTSDLPLLREIAVDGENALLIPPEDHLALAGAVGRLLSDEALVEGMVVAQRQIMATRLSPENLIEEHLSLYNEVIAGEKGILQPSVR